MKPGNKKFRFIFCVLLLLWSVFIFFQYIIGHRTYTLFLRIIDTAFFPVVWMIYLALIALCIGRLLLHRVLRYKTSPLTEAVISLGMTLISFLQILNRGVVITFLVILMLISIPEIFKLIRKLKTPKLKMEGKLRWFMAFALFIFILINLCFALSPPIGLDEQQYHLTAPQKYIENGGFYPITSIGGQARYPQNIEMLYTLALIVNGDIFAKLINYSFGILGIFLIFAFCREFFRFSGLLPSLIFYGSWVVYYVSSRANVELPLAFFEGCALFALCLSWKKSRENDDNPDQNLSSPDQRLFILSAVFAGFTMGIKYSFILSFMGLICLIIYFSYRGFRKSIKPVFKRILLYGIISTAIFSPWIIKNTVVYHNPLEPFHAVRLVAFVKGVINPGEEAAEPSSEKEFDRMGILNKSVYPRNSVKELILIPYNSTIHGEWGRQVFDTLVSPFYLMFLPFVFFLRKKKRIVIALLIYTVVFYLQWMFLQPISRYLVPLMIIMAILIGYLVQRIEKSTEVISRITNYVLKAIITVMILLILTHLLLLFISNNPLLYMFGFETRTDYLKRNNLGGIQHAIEYINEETPKDSYIYLLWEKRAYYIERKTKEDTFGNIFASLMYEHEDPAKVAEELKKMGFTHILCDFYIPSQWFGSSYDEKKAHEESRNLGRRELDFFKKMAEKHLEQIQTNSNVRLYKMK